jgi:hypothetical protein
MSEGKKVTFGRVMSNEMYVKFEMFVKDVAGVSSILPDVPEFKRKVEERLHTTVFMFRHIA